MRVGIVGAGLNSDYHINFSKAYKGAQIVGIADSDLSRAQECAKKYGITGVYGSVTELLQEAKLDVVHVVTPPRTHYDVVREVLEAKCHVLVEKPLALTWEEAKDGFNFGTLEVDRRGRLTAEIVNTAGVTQFSLALTPQ
jgi:predicted dehydrogenase